MCMFFYFTRVLHLLASSVSHRLMRDYCLFKVSVFPFNDAFITGKPFVFVSIFDTQNTPQMNICLKKIFRVEKIPFLFATMFCQVLFGRCI